MPEPTGSGWLGPDAPGTAPENPRLALTASLLCRPRPKSGVRAVALGGLRGCAVVILALAAATAGPARLPLLTTARAAHDMTADEAARGYPVHLRAVVTYYDPFIDPRHGALFVLDQTGGIFVAVPLLPVLPIHAGTLLDITGVTDTADFAPIVNHARIRVIGEAPLPVDVPRASLARMWTGEEDGKWMEAEGVVHSVRETALHVTLDLALSDGRVPATTRKEPGVDYTRLVDAKVKIHANVAPFFNAFHQLSGAHLFFPSMAQVQIEEPAASDPFGLPVLTVNRLLRYEPNVIFRHRVHIRGRVTLFWPGRSLCIQDATQGLCAATDQSTPLGVGYLVDVAGFAAAGGFTPTVTDAIFRRAGNAQPILPVPVTAAQALRGDHDSALVQVKGQLIGLDRTAAEPALAILSGNTVFAAVLPQTAAGDGASRWTEGSTVRITGICSVQVDAQQMAIGSGVMRPASFRILLRSPRDVVTVEQASWWNRQRALAALFLVAFVAISVFAWVLLLRKRVREQTAAIDQEEERYRSLVDHAPDIVFASDLHGNLTSVNPAAEFLLGYTQEELLGQNIWDLLPAAQREAAREHLRRLISGESPGPLECEIQVKGGGILIVEVNLSLMRKRGQPVAMHGILRDATERHRLEEQLLQAQKMEAIGRLAGGVAHDFNNLLTVINGYSDMLIKDLPENDPQRPAIEEIRGAGERAASLTKQLLTFGRRQISRPRPLELNVLVRGAERMLQQLIGEDIVLETSLDPALDLAMADPGQMHQVLLNLSINARDAMPDGGRLLLATANARFEAENAPPGCRPGAYVKLTVTDTGAGMAEETMRHLFEPFFTTKPSGLGTGLGLATVYGIVEQGGGSVGVFSEPGKGCRFDIYLPCAEGPAEQVSASALEPPQRHRDLTVLVVEDQDSVRGLACLALRACGYHVLEASSGDEALRLAEAVEGGCQLAVTDVVMPGMSGKTLAEQLRARWPEIKVLYMSGYPNEVLLRHGLMNDEIHYLEKPFTPSDLAAKVRQVMG
jgi:PAS domain S-box-containing protein